MTPNKLPGTILSICFPEDEPLPFDVMRRFPEDQMSRG